MKQKLKIMKNFKKTIKGFSLEDSKAYYKMMIITIIRWGKDTQVSDIVLQVSWEMMGYLMNNASHMEKRKKRSLPHATHKEQFLVD